MPQVYSQGLKPGMTADLTFNELPGKKFTGHLVRTSRQIDPTSRTLLVEFDVDNRKGELFPGAYTEVHFKSGITAPSFIVPVSALMFRSEGLRIAMVDEKTRQSSCRWFSGMTTAPRCRSSADSMQMIA